MISLPLRSQQHRAQEVVMADARHVSWNNLNRSPGRLLGVSPDELEECGDADGLRPLDGYLEEAFTWRISICGLNLSSKMRF